MKKTKTYNVLPVALFVLTLQLINGSSSAATPPPQSPNTNSSTFCSRVCGGISIPFPFGIGRKDCYLNDWYEVVCKTTNSGSSNITVPFLSRINRELVNISVVDDHTPYGVLYIKGPVTSLGCSRNNSQVPQKSSPDLNVMGNRSPYFITDENRLVVVACGAKALMTDIESEILGCESSCEENSKSGEEITNSICNGYKCCQTRLPSERPQVIGINIENSNGTNTKGCSVAFLTNKRYTPMFVTNPEQFYSRGYAVVELGWYFDTNSDFRSPLGCTNVTSSYVSNGSDDSCNCEYNYFSEMSYRNCYCSGGYTGNPYLRGGCVDIDECKGPNDCAPGTCVNTLRGYGCGPEEIKLEKAPVLPGVLIGLGVLIFVLVFLGLYKFVKKRKKIMRNKQFFKRNGGLLLKQHLTTSKNGNIEMSRIFSSKELKKATDNFSKNRVLGQGGQGTVYKGMLVDGRIVAVKRSKVIDEDKMDEFINEVVLLSQINHRNIVRLLGCCLETEVPILVYEYISNGDLFKRLHDESDDYTMTWEVRLRIAIEIAGALSYMHSTLSFPIFHRDIKTTNILLDDKYRAIVSDFGTSRSVTIDQTHLTTLVAGTFGYMDPEYFLSSQYTHKSDVYSFGVVLVELITGEKPLSCARSEEGRGLANYFLEAMKVNKVIDIIDIRIKDESNLEQVMVVAKLARKCLNRKGKNRPNMRDVSIELERIHSSPKDLEVQTEDKDGEED